MKTLEESILELVHAPGYRRVKPRVIAQQLNLSKEEAVDVRRAVKQLVAAAKSATPQTICVIAGHDAEGFGVRRFIAAFGETAKLPERRHAGRKLR